MPHFDGNGVLLTVWCAGVGGSALALGCLLLEKYFGHPYGRLLAGIAAPLWFGCAAWLGARGHRLEEWTPMAALGVTSLTAWAIHFKTFLRFTRRLVRPRAIWMLLLIVSPLYALHVTSGVNRAGFEGTLLDRLVLDRNEVSGLRVVTDRGRQIKLFRFVISQEAEQAERDWVAEGCLECRVIRTAGVDPDSNCHGWVFADGRFALRCEDVEDVLADNGYQPVQRPRKGDLIVYRNELGAIQHSGIVAELISENLVLIESKWGPLGRYLHLPEYQPYGTNFTYHRSPRQGHHLLVVSPTEESSVAPPTL